MFISSLCPPVLVYIGFSIILIIIDIYNGIFNKAILKFIVMIVFSLIINILCDLGYNVIAWFLVFIPIIMMTIISTLLLKVFGLNPQDSELKTKVQDMSGESLDELDVCGNYLSGSNLLNQQKYSFYFDRFNSVERVDRDQLREDLYFKIDNLYDLSNNYLIDGNLDISYNPIRYYLANTFINIFGEQIFIDNNKNSRLFNFIFSGYNIGYKSKGDNNMSYIEYSQNNTTNPINKVNKDYDISYSINNQNKSNNNSYTEDYQDTYLLDGFLLFKQYKYNSVKDSLTNTNPDITDDEIDKFIENEWNNLSAAEQNNWNTESENNQSKNDENNLQYNPYDY
jgi:hypothetical protein